MSGRAARGRAAEQRARAYLAGQGLRTRARNARFRTGEIDLVMEDGETIVFVEVRYRSRTDYGGAAASVDRGKQQRLTRAAAQYLARHGLAHRPARFDVVALGPDDAIDWIRAAFEAT